MNKIKIDFKSPWTMLFALCMGVALMTSLAFADEEPIGYTEDGLPIYMEDLPVEARQEILEKHMAEANALLEEAKQENELSQELSVDRLLEIDIKNIMKVNVNVLNINTAELYLDDKVYTVIVDCKLTEIDNFQWQTMGDGKLNIGDFAIVRRNPFTYFDNPNLELTKEQIEAKLEDWDMDQRVCFIKALQKAGNIETPDVVGKLNIRG